MKISMNYRSIQTNLFFTTILFTLLSMGSVQAQTHTPRANRAMTSNTNGYYEYLPEGYNPTGTTLHPLIIMIHGRGEYGDGGTSQLPRVTNHGLGRAIRDGQFYKSYTVNGKTHKFVVLTPQWKSQATTAQVNGVIDYALRNYKVDPKRIYLTGLSAGGGVVEMAAADLTVGKRLAAIVQFCGTGTPSTTRAANIVSNNVAFWGIHNKYDDVVPSSKTTGWVNMIRSIKSTFPAKSTIPLSSSHNAWQSRYPASWTEGGLSIYQWMLQYARGTVSTTPLNVVPVANAGSDKTITLPTSSVTLSGSGTDADGSIAKYAWTKIAGPSYFTFSSTTVASPTVSGLVAGTYTFRLTVTDDKGATDYDDVNVVVGSTTTTTYAVPGKVEAEKYINMSGVQTETTTDLGGGSNVGYIDLGDWMDYSVKTTASGTYSVRFRVASGSATGSQFQVKNSSGTILATVNVPATGGYQTWKDVTASVKLVSGTQTLRLVSTIAARWNLNYLYFSTSTTSSSSTTTATKIEAENYSSMSGVSTETTTDAGGGLNVRAIDQNDWMEYNISPSTSGTYTFTFRLASIYTGAKFDVLNGAGTVLATVTVPNTGGAQTWTNVTASIALPAGAQTIMLYSKGTYRWNINYFTFGASGTTAGTQAATQAVEEDATATQSLAISPNPFVDRFVLTVNNSYTGTMKVQLIDASGVVRKEFQVLKNAAGTVQTYLSAGTLPAGNYFLKVQMENWSQTKQVVKL